MGISTIWMLDAHPSAFYFGDKREELIVEA